MLELVAERGPSCGPLSVVLIDGPAGSGKTSLAAALASAVRAAGADADIVHMDDLYDGWDGLAAGADAVTGLLRAIAAGRPGRYQRYDWDRAEFVEWVELAPVDLLIVEGVGSTSLEHLDLVSALVWVAEAAPAERLRRGLARDGAQSQAHWRRWMRAEQELFARVGTAALADIWVDGQGRLNSAGPSAGLG
ncbi:MAG: uridine kinase [Beutenbergiaceae bacterium]